MEEMSTQLDNSPESGQVSAKMRRLDVNLDLDHDSCSLVSEHPALLRAVDGLEYSALLFTSGPARTPSIQFRTRTIAFSEFGSLDARVIASVVWSRSKWWVMTDATSTAPLAMSAMASG